MGKALLLKNVDFAANKLDTVTYSEIIPCTGVVLSQNAITFAALEATAQLTVTKIPSNTTDELIWESSDTDVATVVGGLVTCTGVGTATITASCGSQTATCTITSTVTIVLDTDYYPENGYKYSGSMDLSANPPKNHIGRAVSQVGRLFYSTVEYGTYRVFSGTENEGKYAIPLPSGATSARVIFPTGMEKRHFSLVLANANEKQTYVGGANGNSALGIQLYQYNSNTDAQIDIDIHEYAPYANGFIASWTFVSSSQTDPATITNPTVIIFSGDTVS